MKQMTLQSNDFVPYFEYIDTKGKVVGPDENCQYRSIRASQIANLDLDYGMVFQYLPQVKSFNPFAKYGYICLFSYHVWNIKGDKLYDSKKQREAIWGDEEYKETFERFNVGDKVLVYDGEHLNALVKQGTRKAGQAIQKCLHNLQLKAAMKGYRHIYIAGFSLNPINGHYMPLEDWNDEIDFHEKKVEKCFA